jgi:hypothetical protein
MTATLFLRIAAVLSLINCAGHTGGLFSSPRHGAEEVAVLETMKAHQFDFMDRCEATGTSCSATAFP